MVPSGRPDRSGATESGSLFAWLVSRADAARDERRNVDAAALYGEALRLSPQAAAIHIQCAHMLKESGQLAPAEQHYLEALRLTPNDPDLSLQLGHFYKVAARPDKAQEAYQRALRLRPQWETPARELNFLKERGWRGSPGAAATRSALEALAGIRDGDLGVALPELAGLVPALMPRRAEERLRHHDERIEVQRLGRREEGHWGVRRTLRGVEAIRGYCLSSAPLLEVQVLLNGLAIHRGPLKGGYELADEADKRRIKKYVFNVWLDFSGFACGRHALELRFFEYSERTRSFQDDVVIAQPAPVSAFPASNALVEVSYTDPRPIEEQIRTRPSVVRSAKRRPFPDGLRNVLVMRTDQLGDLVASVPALRRLRQIAPQAHIVGLLTSANEGLARTLGLFDEVIAVDFPDDRTERRRLMTFDAQKALRQRLAPYAFDIAIDLADSDVSRDLLRLTGAKFLYAKGGGDRPWLSADLTFTSRDPWSGNDNPRHSAKVLALVEGLGALLHDQTSVVRRTDLSRRRLQAYGVGPDERYALLHTGARIRFSHWPYFGELAALLLQRTDLKIVMMAEDPQTHASLPRQLQENARLVFVGGRLPFDDFDAFVSFATVMAANDSGPKHLAALRGVRVVSIFTARNSWEEWAQEDVGVIVSRRVPCAGCVVQHDPEECGKDFACIVDIKPDEVFAAMTALMREAPEVMS